jgi:hypothetical protein
MRKEFRGPKWTPKYLFKILFFLTPKSPSRRDFMVKNHENPSHRNEHLLYNVKECGDKALNDYKYKIMWK